MRSLIVFSIVLSFVFSSCRKDKPATTPQEPPVEIAPAGPSSERLQEIQKLLDGRQYEAALARIDEERKNFPEHEKLLFMRGFSLFNLQKYEDALAAFDALRQKGKSSLELTVALSETLFSLKRFDECEKVLREGMEKFPKAAALWYSLGGIYAEKGDWEQASKMYGEALLRQADFAPALLSAGDVAYRQGDMARARAHFEKLAGVKGHEALAHLKLAVVDMKEKKWDAARGHLDEVRSMDPQNAELPRIESALDSARLLDELSGHLNAKRCLQAKETLKTIQERHGGHPMLPKAIEAVKKACPK